MPGLVPGIHVLSVPERKDEDGRDEPGHDERMSHVSKGRLYFPTSTLPTMLGWNLQ
jgi:hypothetical protein